MNKKDVKRILELKNKLSTPNFLIPLSLLLFALLMITSALFGIREHNIYHYIIGIISFGLFYYLYKEHKKTKGEYIELLSKLK